MNKVQSTCRMERECSTLDSVCVCCVTAAAHGAESGISSMKSDHKSDRRKRRKKKIDEKEEKGAHWRFQNQLCLKRDDTE